MANLVATVRAHVEMEPTTCGIRRCTDWYIYLPIILRIVQLQYPARTVPPFVCSSERNLEKLLCKDSQTLMGTGSAPGTVRILVQVIIPAPRHSYIILPHKTRSCFSMIDSLLSFTYLHQVLKSQNNVRVSVTLMRVRVTIVAVETQ